MKIKNITKIIFVTILAIVILASCTSAVEARPAPEVTMLLASSSAGVIDPNKFSPSDISNEDEAYKMAGTIVTTLSTVAIVVGIVGLIILGIKYMMGSVEEKAEYKKTLIPMLIGFIMIFAIGTIVKVIASITQNLSDVL